MKTNVSIKFNSIEEYREIEKKLIEMGCENDKDWNDYMIDDFEDMNYLPHVVDIYDDLVFSIHLSNSLSTITLQEFLND